jgi:hypothetical protein
MLELDVSFDGLRFTGLTHLDQKKTILVAAAAALVNVRNIPRFQTHQRSIGLCEWAILMMKK